MLARALDSGAAAERFARMVAALGGPADLMQRPDAYLAAAPLIRPVPAAHGGFVTAIDTRALGLAVVALGGGRVRAQDPVDPSVGLTGIASLSQAMQSGEPLAFVHARDEQGFAQASRAVMAAMTIGEHPPRETPLVLRRVSA
jgi:thymidine phosphorylase